jgi:hypothetical protein
MSVEREKKKSDEEAKKEQIKQVTEKANLCRGSGV